jgi:hypothetical protein
MVYAHYLSQFVDRPKVSRFLEGRLKDSTNYDWQKMWVIAALMQRKKGSGDAVASAWSILEGGLRHDALRAVAAIFVGR